MAFKQKGFPSHKGVKKNYSGFHKGKAVFKSHVPTHKEGEMEYSDTEWDDWQKGETTKTDTGTTRTDTRTGVQKGKQVEKFAETPEEKAAYAQYLEDVDAGKIKRNTKYDDREVTDTRTETTENEGPEGNLWFRSGTSNVRTGGTAQDFGYTGGMDVKPDQSFSTGQAIASWGGQGGGDNKVDVNSVEFANDPAYQQMLTNLNFELAVHTSDRDLDRYQAVDRVRDSEGGRALSSILSAGSPEDQRKAFEMYKEQHPELSTQPEGTSGVNPLQNQTSGQFVSGQRASDAASVANTGTNTSGETFQQVRDRISAERAEIKKRKEMEAKNITYQGNYEF